MNKIRYITVIIITFIQRLLNLYQLFDLKSRFNLIYFFGIVLMSNLPKY